ncbi:MAG: transposase [Oligoflexus sp.]|nr:transposase [Oligoflexus sp.]
MSISRAYPSKIEQKEVETNGPLGKAMEYSLKRWTKLTVFTRVAGAHLSNAAALRAIKSAITHRRNSSAYDGMVIHFDQGIVYASHGFRVILNAF